MFRRNQVAVLSLVLGLCVPVLAQPERPIQASARSVVAQAPAAPGASPKVKDDHRYRHLDNQEEEDLLDEGPVETEPKTLDFLRTYEPEVFQEIEKMKTVDPEEYGHMITMESHHVRMLEDLQTDDKEGFRLAIAQLRAHDRVGALAQACREGDHANRAELKAAVEQLFDARQASERHQLELDRKDLEDSEKELQTRDSKRASIVEHYVHSITIPDAERW